MKISVRPVRGEAFEMEAEPGDTVEALKGKVASLKPDMPVGAQKMVFSGKVLQDAATLADCGVKEGDFLVVMVAKPKPAPGAEVPMEPAAASAVAAQTPSAPSAPSAPAAPAAPAIAPGAVGGPANEATVQMMCDMGFPRNLVEQCLRAAFNNPDRAVDYLMSGIPPHLQALARGEAPPPAPAPPAPGQQAQMPGFPQMPMVPMANATGPLAKLQNHPLFFRLKAAVQQNPAALNEVMACIEKVDPTMIPLIAEHQEEFVAILAEPGPGMPMAPPVAPAPGGAAPSAGSGAAQDPVAAMMAAMQAAQQGGGAGAPGAPAAGAAPSAAAQQRPAAPAAPPQLSPQENEAVIRLMGLGFDRASALQAYIACDRNEELAASSLFDMADGDGGDDDDDN
eukprot:CAMPEP_0176063400 /NCGR_PEP_ID=MMETSP0120_2-20121206/31620_1 /TAXON_ID=160619 /ORGANISM="Kryptoperidinium foliaceum, Strain CCMP 1326" /LENGTH=394 /DNA_ID=CAMNT_0017396973 /DNA_START=38 /DNA_END=1223 /DNA_ORIENTATION=+